MCKKNSEWVNNIYCSCTHRKLILYDRGFSFKINVSSLLYFGWKYKIVSPGIEKNNKIYVLTIGSFTKYSNGD